MKSILTVSEVNKYIKEIISRDLVLSNLWIRGEISNYKYHYSGHMYFTIKDENSVIKCVMFKTQASTLKFSPENGMKVIIRGYISVFERDGQYQLYSEEMQPDGIGTLHMAFEQLKKKLQAEGLFDMEHKKRIPFLPRTIGVVTSSTGAVIKDIINVLSRRFPNMHLKVYPVAVQGELASRQISKAIDKLNELKCVDVIIIARGGGSLEELWAFNEELVARSIYKSIIPVISAVGHETDFTIADFVADMRAPTPSAAAELVIPEKSILKTRISNLNSRLKNSLTYNLNSNRARLTSSINSPSFKHPFDRIYQERMRLDIFNKYLKRALVENHERKRSNFKLLIGKLNTLSPLSILARGYSIVKSKKNGDLIKSVVGINKGDEIEVDVSDGKIVCTVNGSDKKNEVI